MNIYDFSPIIDFSSSKMVRGAVLFEALPVPMSLPEVYSALPVPMSQRGWSTCAPVAAASAVGEIFIVVTCVRVAYFRIIISSGRRTIITRYLTRNMKNWKRIALYNVYG